MKNTVLLAIALVSSAAACGEGGGATTSAAPSNKPASAVKSGSAAPAGSGSAAAAPSGAASAAPAASASASAAAGSGKGMSCDAISTKNVCVEFSGTGSKQDVAQGVCDSEQYKGKFGTTECPKENRIGMCTTDTGNPTETITYVYSKGAKELKGPDAKKLCPSGGDWIDL